MSQAWPPEEGRRILGWQRAVSTPLLALAAVDEAAALRGVQADQKAVRRRAAIGSAALLVFTAVLVVLSRRWQRRRASTQRPASA